VKRNKLPATVWTIGHSTRSLQELIETLDPYRIELVADVRRFPNSRKNSQFNQNGLGQALSAARIDYLHFPDLGGRRRPAVDSRNTVWNNESFPGYADYMESPEFRSGIDRLIKFASQRPAVIMCAEAVWWRCHRRLISDYLTSIGVEVIHIFSASHSKPHQLTPAARIVGGK